MLLITVIVVYIIIALSMVISLLLNGVRPSKTLGWLLAIFTIPVGGFLLYLMLGRNRRKNKLFPVDGNQINANNTKDGKSNTVKYVHQIKPAVNMTF